MNIEEFSNEFDTLINSYSAIELFGNISERLELDEYEKSVFLTQALELIVLEFYKGNEPFESTEEIRRYLSSLVKTSKISKKESNESNISENSSFFKLPNDLWFITYESVTLLDPSLGCKDNTTIGVVPVTLDDYQRIKDNPFRGANTRRALRLDIENNIVEIVSKYNIKLYNVRYLSLLSPIILVDLPNSISINNETKKTECKLNPVIHRMILERAVRLALSSKSIGAGK